jgi:hypothetical protein
LSARYGRERANFSARHYTKSYKLGKQLFDRFVAEFGSPICAEVQTFLFGQSFNMWDAKEYKAFQEAGGHADKCPSVAGKVAEWTVELLLNAEDYSSERSSGD